MLGVHPGILMVLILLISAFISPVLDQFKFKRFSFLAIIISGVIFLLSILFMIRVNTVGIEYYNFGGWSPDKGIEFVFGNLEALMLVLISGMFLIVYVYNQHKIRDEIGIHLRGWYFTLAFLLQASLNGMILTNDLFNMFVFIEISALTTVAIISINENKDTIFASIKYLFLTTVGSSSILFSIGILYLITGYLNMDLAGTELTKMAEMYPAASGMAMLFMFFGLAMKSALFPLHIWLPDAYSSAPIISTVIMAGIVGKAYIVVFIKVFYKVLSLNFFQLTNLSEITIFLAGLAIIIGSLFAIGQTKIKRMLAYSSVAQIGYIFLGLALATEDSLTGGILHIINHSVNKSLLFLTVGIIIMYAGIENIDDFSGVGKKYPFTMLLFALASLAMVGIPPLNGFMSKWTIIMGILEAGKPAYLVIILLSSLLNGVYYLPIIIQSFFGGNDDFTYRWEFKRLGVKIILPMLTLAIIILLIGIFPSYPLNYINKIVINLMN
ncbi:MAG: complex I subunit 5 family protein [Bacillota bacterium]